MTHLTRLTRPAPKKREDTSDLVVKALDVQDIWDRYTARGKYAVGGPAPAPAAEVDEDYDPTKDEFYGLSQHAR